MSDIIHAIATRMEDALNKQLGQGNTSALERFSPTLFGFGEDFLMQAVSEASTALCFATNPTSGHPTLLERRMPSLISAGLVSGIIPMSIRKLSLQEIQAIVSRFQDGVNAG